MADFATLAEFASSLNVEGVDNKQAELALQDASADVRMAVGWSITEETVTRSFLGGRATIFLPTLFLTAVSVVVEDGVTLAASNYVVDLDTATVSRGSGGYATGWWSHRGRVVITFTHGVVRGRSARETTIFDKARGEVFRRGARLYASRLGLASETVGNLSWSLPRDEGDTLGPLRLPVLA